jgi:hypothetical protein
MYLQQTLRRTSRAWRTTVSDEHWYRMVDGTRYADGSFCVICLEFRVLQHTPKGVWLHAPDENNGVHGERKLVLLPDAASFAKGYDPGRRFAYPTEEMAWWSYRRRKQVQASILRSQLAHAERLCAALDVEGSFLRQPGLFGSGSYHLRDGRNAEFRHEEY